MNVCCDRKKCTGRKTECNQYCGFQQITIFDTIPEPKFQAAPRHPIEYYGLTKERVAELESLMQSGKYDFLVSQVAYKTNEMIAEYILLSTTKGKSYDAMKIKWELKEMEQMPCGRSDFYGWRRYFYSIFNKEIRRVGK